MPPGENFCAHYGKPATATAPKRKAATISLQSRAGEEARLQGDFDNTWRGVKPS
jgi:hypothetical protein